MNTFLWIFIAFAFGLLLFTSLQEKLPDELSFLKSNTSSQSTGSSGWKINQQGDAVELSYSMANSNEGYPGAILGILCYKGALDLRLNPQVPTTGIETTLVAVSGKGEELWEKGNDIPQSKTYNIYPKQPVYFIKHLISNPMLQFKISTLAEGVQTYSFNGQGLATALTKIDSNCQAQIK